MASKARERSGKASASDTVMQIKVNDQVVTVDQRTLTMRERQQIKRELALLDYEADEMDALMGAIWVVMRRDDKTITYEEVCESITVADLEDAKAVEEEDHPES